MSLHHFYSPGKKFGLKYQPNAWGNEWIFMIKQIEKLCYVVKHLESGRALKK